MNRTLILNGFMATGKSTVGQLVANSRGVPFFDLDQLIEQRAGKSVRALFQDEGELAFRKLESSVLKAHLFDRRESSARPFVLSVGGGALLDRETRLVALESAVVVTLSAKEEEIVRRAEAEDAGTSSRPLLAGGDAREKVSALLGARAAAYAECHGVIRTDGRSAEDIASEVSALWDQDAVAVAAGEQSYCVHIGAGLIKERLSGLLGSPSGVLLVTDENVEPLYGAMTRQALGRELHGQALLTPGEEHKDLASLARIYQAAFEGNLDRKSTFVGLGGGVATDMTGFAAATWVRGVRWLALPTTLLSMVDASVGGKTAVDFNTAKNSVGAFWQPAGVICDVSTLKTETERAYVGALSEVVKTALIGDAELLTFLEENSAQVLARDEATVTKVVERCVRVKAGIVARDEREQSIRAHLNLGHTIGHALESSGGYTALTHGEAVSLGLVAALRLGEKRGHTPRALTARVLGLMKQLGLPHVLGRDALLRSTALMGHDKKRAGAHVRFVYARAAGEVFSENIPLTELCETAPALADPA